jgi:hypothetical protein
MGAIKDAEARHLCKKCRESLVAIYGDERVA